MATKSFEELNTGALTIKNNELPESNTHTLVGNQLVDMVAKEQEIDGKAAQLRSDLDDLTLVTDETQNKWVFDNDNLEQGLLNKKDGGELDDTNYHRTPFIEVVEGDVVFYKATIGGAGYYPLFLYNSDKTFLGMSGEQSTSVAVNNLKGIVRIYEDGYIRAYSRKLYDFELSKQNTIPEYIIANIDTALSKANKSLVELGLYDLQFKDLVESGSIDNHGNDRIVATYARSEYIPILKGDNVTVKTAISGPGSYSIFEYNLDKVFIKTRGRASDNPFDIIETSYQALSDGYIRVIGMKSTHGSYQPYDFILKVTPDKRVRDNIKSIEDTISTQENKLSTLFTTVDYSDRIEDGALGSTGKLMVSDKYFRTFSISVHGGDVINISTRVSGEGFSAAFIYDANGTVLEKYGTLPTGDAANFNESIIAPGGASTLRVMGMNETHTAYQPYIFKVEVESINVKSSDFTMSSFSSNPILKAMKETNFTDGSVTNYSAYLYQFGNDFYFSKNRKGDLHYIFQWDSSLSDGQQPLAYSAGITDDGDVIFVYRTERLPTNQDESVRKNPIIYEKSNGYKGKVIDFGTEIIKPSGWLQNSGFVYSKKLNCFFIAEYTRPSVLTSNLWKVEKPFDVASNWRKVKTFELSGTGSGFKHMHKVDIDPYTGIVWASTGDDDSAAAIYYSTDGGETFNTSISGSEKYGRELNFVFTEDYIYWTTDSTGSKHWLFRATRNEGGFFELSDVEDLHMFPAESRPTYATIYLKSIDLLVFLGRNDGDNTFIDIEGWDLKNNTFVHIDRIQSVEGASVNVGFRCECFEIYPKGNTFSVGFSGSQGAGTYQNYLGILGNTLSGDRINNVVITINRIGDGFVATYDTQSF